jgi:hypothetical protein
MPNLLFTVAGYLSGDNDLAHISIMKCVKHWFNGDATKLNLTRGITTSFVFGHTPELAAEWIGKHFDAYTTAPQVKYHYEKLWREYPIYRTWLTKFNDNSIIKWDAQQIGDSTSTRVSYQRSPELFVQAVQSAILKRRHELLSLLVSNLANKIKRADLIACMNDTGGTRSKGSER